MAAPFCFTVAASATARGGSAVTVTSTSALEHSGGADPSQTWYSSEAKPSNVSEAVNRMWLSAVTSAVPWLALGSMLTVSDTSPPGPAVSLVSTSISTALDWTTCATSGRAMGSTGLTVTFTVAVLEFTASVMVYEKESVP
jgi:hypothetical protein